ncbi:MAG: hypothetical protein JF606_21450 [Burkholderiales bacterium]|nr:hypothetical protein [Burkholderiales bacterium]
MNLHGSEGRNEGSGNNDKTLDQFAHFVLQSWLMIDFDHADGLATKGMSSSFQ